MSWQSYVDEQLVGTGHLAQGCIIGLDGSVWAQSPGFTLKAGEGQSVSALFKNPQNVFAAGITISGIKYLGIKGDERSVYGKKGASGVVTVKTTQCILIGLYNDQQQPGNASLSVEKLADYLIENGY